MDSLKQQNSNNSNRSESNTEILKSINSSILKYYHNPLRTSTTQQQQQTDTNRHQQIYQHGSEEEGVSQSCSNLQLLNLSSSHDQLVSSIIRLEHNPSIDNLSHNDRLSKQKFESLSELLILMRSIDWMDYSSSTFQLVPLVLTILEKVYSIDRSSIALIQLFRPILDLSLIKLWWQSIISPVLTNLSLQSSIDRSSIQSLSNVLLFELDSDYNINESQDKSSMGLVMRCFEIYEDQIMKTEKPTLIRSILIKWAKSRPKNFYRLIETLILVPSPRRRRSELNAINLLIDFMSDSPYSIHHLSMTRIPDYLMDSIIDHQPKGGYQSSKQQDQNRLERLDRRRELYLIKLKLDCLVMCLPRLPQVFQNSWARVLICFVRALGFEHQNSNEQEGDHQEGDDDVNQPIFKDRLLNIRETFSVMRDEEFYQSCKDLFSLIYGLIPCNFIEFLKRPMDYISNLCDRDLPDVIDSNTIRALITPIVSQHRLDLSLIYDDPELELKEFSNKLKFYEPAELVGKVESKLIPLTAATADATFSTLAKDSVRLDDDSNVDDGSGGSKADENFIDYQVRRIDDEFAKQRLDLIRKKDPLKPRKASKSPNVLKINEPVNEMDDGRGDLIEDLKLKILILKSRLNVQIYFEQLHLQQIGSLHKSNILGTALEAENQNLQTINKHLRQNLERSSQVHDSKLISRKNITNLIDNDQVLSDNTHNQPRANNSKSTTRISPKTITDEHEDSQAEDSIKRSRKLLKDDQSKRYIESIKAKNKKFRADLMALKQDRSEAEQKIKVYDQVVYRLNGRINELENEAHELRNELKLIRPKLKTIDELEMTNENLSKALLTWDDDLRRFRESRKEIDVIRGEWKKFESISNSLEIENRKIRDELKKQTCMNEDLKLENDLFRRKDRERIDKERQHILFKRKIRLKSFSVEDVTRQGNSSERSLSLRKDRGDDEEVDGERRKNGHEDSKVESPIGGKETGEE